jgi:TolA-binding protein
MSWVLGTRAHVFAVRASVKPLGVLLLQPLGAQTPYLHDGMDRPNDGYDGLAPAAPNAANATPSTTRAWRAVVCYFPPMREPYDELSEIKREIIESRGLVIKTNNLTNALSADIKSIAKRQQSYERRLWWSSSTSYVVFVVVIFTALKFAWDARVDAIRSETEQRAQEADRLRKEVRDAEKRDEDRAKAQAKAAQYYDLIRQGKRQEIVDGYDAIMREDLTKTEQAVFADAVEKARSDLAAQSYQQGLDKARVQRWQEAASAFEESLRYKETSPIAPNVKLALADAYRHLGRPRDAIPILMPLSESAPDKEIQDDALFWLALCQTDIQAWNEAKNTYRTLIRRFPDSHYVAEAKMNLTTLQLTH